MTDPHEGHDDAPDASGSQPDPPAIERDLLGHAPPAGRRTWDHRRAEPRMLALLWTIYLFVATLLTFASAGLLGFVTPDSYRPSAKTLLLLVFLGATIFWPMLRLAQQAPREHVGRACLKDALVIIAPAQAIIWPQVFLTHWPFQVLLFISIAMTGWVALCAAMLAWALADRGPSRTGWMFVFIALGAVAPALILVDALRTGGFAGRDDVRWLWMGSPWTVPFELTRDRPWTGAAAIVLQGHRVAAWTTLAIGLAAWCIPRPSVQETTRETD